MSYIKAGYFYEKVLPVLRVINYILLALFALLVTTKLEELIILPMGVFLITFVFAPFLAMVVYITLMKNHEFLEWDKGERIKKNDFSFSVLTTVFPLSFISMFLLTGYISHVITNKFDVFEFCFFGFLIIISFSNTIFTVPLHYNALYKQSLDLSNDVKPKPEYW
jgi:hypothetical protein